MSVNLLALAESLLQQESDVLDISQGAFPFPLGDYRYLCVVTRALQILGLFQCHTLSQTNF